MNAFEQIKAGFDAYCKSFGVIGANKLGRYFILPVVINMVLLSLLVWGGHAFGNWVGSLIDSSGEGWMGFLASAVGWVITAASVVLFIFIGGQLCAAIMSPVYTTLSEKVDTAITGREFSSSAAQTMKDLWRTVVISIKNIIKELLLTLVLFLLLNFIPIVGPVLSLVAIFLLNSYYMGYAFMDYTNERYRRSSSLTSDVVYHYKWLSITIGSIYMLSLLIPVIGPFVGAFVGGISTAAATMAQIQIEEKDPQISTLLSKA